ncbi:MAG: hypothetical protein HY904_17145 [Deltaproteobacteria bacterium]|nr:hypothetical protein [Deltaproteobacteria bacterium]
MSLRPAVLLVAASLLLSCGDASPFKVHLVVRNPSMFAYDGSGGALGLGLEIRVDGVEAGGPLLVSDSCLGRRCGDVADPGRCGDPSRRVEPGHEVRLHWDGRYFPRSADPLGPCTGEARAVEVGAHATFTLCGRLSGEGIRAATLVCEDHALEVLSVENALELSVPGAPPVAP